MSRALLVMVFLLWFPCLLTAQETDDFQQGLTAFQNKNYADAKSLFEKSLAKHGNQASVLHNLALTHLQLGEKGWAMALWRKALSVDPGFLPAQLSRNFLEEKYQMRSYEKDPAARMLNRQLEGFSFDQLLFATALLLATSGWLWIRFLRNRRIALEEMQPSPHFPLVATVFSGLMLLSVLTLGYKASRNLSDRATALVGKVSAKSLPSDDGANLFEIEEGNEVLVRRQQGNWVQVTNSDGLSGWVGAAQIMITSGWQQ